MVGPVIIGLFGDKDTAIGKPSALKLWVTMFTNEAPGE